MRFITITPETPRETVADLLPVTPMALREKKLVRKSPVLEVHVEDFLPPEIKKQRDMVGNKERVQYNIQSATRYIIDFENRKAEAIKEAVRMLEAAREREKKTLELNTKTLSDIEQFEPTIAPAREATKEKLVRELEIIRKMPFVEKARLVSQDYGSALEVTIGSITTSSKVDVNNDGEPLMVDVPVITLPPMIITLSSCSSATIEGILPERYYIPFCNSSIQAGRTVSFCLGEAQATVNNALLHGNLSIALTSALSILRSFMLAHRGYTRLLGTFDNNALNGKNLVPTYSGIPQGAKQVKVHCPYLWSEDKDVEAETYDIDDVEVSERTLTFYSDNNDGCNCDPDTSDGCECERQSIRVFNSPNFVTYEY